MTEEPETISKPTAGAGASTNGNRVIGTALPQADALTVAELGSRALVGTDVDAILEDACQLVADRLNTEFVKILELVPSGEGFLLTAGVGWEPGYVGQVVVPLVSDSHAGYTIIQNQPVVVEDLTTETRFRGMPFLHEHGIVSGVSAVLRGSEHPFGIITAHSRERRGYSVEEIEFLESVAAIVAAVVERRETQQALVDTNERLRLALAAGGMGTWEWRIASNEVIWSESLELMHGMEPGTFPGTFEAYSQDIHPEDRDRVFSTIQQSIESGEHALEYRIVLPNGANRWLSARGIVLRDETGNPERLIGICTDITERRTAEQVLEEDAERKAVLAEASAFLASSLDYEQTLLDVARMLAGKIADICSIDFLQGDQVRRLAIAHVDKGVEERFLALPPTFPAGPNHPIVRVATSRQPVLTSRPDDELAAAARDEQHLHLLKSLGLKSVLIVPLVVGGRSLGTLTLGCVSSEALDREDLEFAEELARRIGFAMDNAFRYEAEQRARQDAEAARERQSFLARASAVLSTSLDYETTLSSLAELCIPYFGDWAAIDVLDDQGNLRRVTVQHSDPAKIAFAQSFREAYPEDTARDQNMQLVLQQGQSLVYAQIPQEVLDRAFENRSAEYVEAVRELGLKSAMIVPLRARGRTLGALTLVYSDESGRTYTEADLSLAEDLGHRAGLAVDNAALYMESERVRAELLIANESKDEFLGLVSHELRTPITTIYGGARLLRSRGQNLDTDSQSDVLEDIEHEAERLHRIVEDLLVLARVELGQEVITEPLLVQRVVEKTIALLTKRRPGRVIESDLKDDLPAVRASAIYLEQILRNLVNNADKYSPPDRPIEVTARSTDTDVVVSVADRGPGIPAEDLDRIFERFYRSSLTAKQAGGAGIGLTVCRRLIEAQNGQIWAQPREGGGLIILFSLPIYEETA